MKIAQVSPLYEAVPPRLYGGTERIVAFLSEALVALGHDVTLFASADARTTARLHPVRDQAIRLDPERLNSDLAAHLFQMAELRARAHDFDIIHFHTDMLQLPFFEDMASRSVTTLHGRLDIKDLMGVYSRFPQFPLVSISDSQRQPLAAANFVATVLHGLPADLLTPPANPRGDYLAFVGRLSPEKRPDRAIQIARAAGMRLRMAAKIENLDIDYFKTTVEPLLGGPDVDFIGEIGEAQKSDFFGHAAAVLFPIDWPEPFGLVMIEAMACGTPVIAWRHGSVPEVVDEGETGFIVDDMAGAVAAVEKARHLSRERVRASFERRFTASAMARSYVEVYRQIIERSSPMKMHVVAA